MPIDMYADTQRLRDIIAEDERNNGHMVDWLIQTCDEYEMLYESIIPAINGLWSKWKVDVRNADMFVIMNDYYDEISHDEMWGSNEE
jgi:hypothetical protein